MPAGTIHTEAVSVKFGALRALTDVTVDLRQGEILGLIGPNGAGKTTLVNVLSGFQRVSSGSVWIDDVDVTGHPPNRIARLGLARTFQSTRVFTNLSVYENALAAAVGVGMGSREGARTAWTLLERFGFADRSNQLAGTMSQGHRRVVGVIRALAMRPGLLLLDEPAAGLDEGESQELVSMIRDVVDEFNCGVMLIEHDMSVVLPLCHRLHVLQYGQTIAQGTPDAVRRDPVVLDAYLGRAAPRQTSDA